tara:strand:- start:693 stop:1223 length:531 start_codon:yes stop_codon:yes gene_type:complete
MTDKPESQHIPLVVTPTAKRFDKLKMRGTPLDLIHSYLLAENPERAKIALQTSVLEALHLALSEIEDVEKVRLCTRVDTHVHDNALYLDIDKTIPVRNINSGECDVHVQGDPTTTVLRLVEQLITHLMGGIEDRLADATGRLCIYIFPELCHTELRRNADQISACVTLPTGIKEIT